MHTTENLSANTYAVRIPKGKGWQVVTRLADGTVDISGGNIAARASHLLTNLNVAGRPVVCALAGRRDIAEKRVTEFSWNGRTPEIVGIGEADEPLVEALAGPHGRAFRRAVTAASKARNASWTAYHKDEALLAAAALAAEAVSAAWADLLAEAEAIRSTVAPVADEAEVDAEAPEAHEAPAAETVQFVEITEDENGVEHFEVTGTVEVEGTPSSGRSVSVPAAAPLVVDDLTGIWAGVSERMNGEVAADARAVHSVTARLARLADEAATAGDFVRADELRLAVYAAVRAGAFAPLLAAVEQNLAAMG